MFVCDFHCNFSVGEKEYDTILLQHKVGIEWPDKSMVSETFVIQVVKR